MNNEENDIERQELARRVGKNGDRILMEYFDDIGLANKTNNEINDLINRLRICGVDIKKVFSECGRDSTLKTRVNRNQAIDIVFGFFREFGIDVSKLLEEGKKSNESGQTVYLSFNKGVKRDETTSPTFAGEDVYVYAKETGTLTDVYSLVHEISHTLYVQNQFGEARMILGEVIPQCMERMLDGYLIELAGRKGFDVDIGTLKENIIKRRISTAIDRFRMASRIAKGEYKFASEKAEFSRYMLAQIYATKLMGMDKSTQKQRIFDFIEALKSNDIKKANDAFDIQIGKENANERDKYIINSIWNLQKDVLTFQENEVLKEQTAGTIRTISKEDEKEPEM